MCGRARFTSPNQIFGLMPTSQGAKLHITPFRLAVPQMTVPFLVQHNGHLVLSSGEWMLDGFYNARSETYKEKWWCSRNHAVLYLDAFYEGGHWFRSEEPMPVAAMYDRDDINKVIMMTTESKGPVTQHHERQPLMIDNVRPWLAGSDFNEAEMQLTVE